MKTGVV